jgi:hypothetical protein
MCEPLALLDYWAFFFYKVEQAALVGGVTSINLWPSLSACIFRHAFLKLCTHVGDLHETLLSISNFQSPWSIIRSRYSDWLRAGRWRGRSSSPGRVENFLFSTSSRPALGPTQTPIQWVPGAKRHGRDANHSPPTSAEVKKTWVYTSTPLYAFMA